MFKRLISVLVLTLLLLALVSVVTTAPASLAANFGQVIKPGLTGGVNINPTLVARYGTGGMGSPARNLAALRMRGPVGVSAPGERMLVTGTLMNNCANTPYRFFNQQLISLLGFNRGLRYTNTVTEMLSLPVISLTVVYSPGVGNTFWPAVYSPTYDYLPMRIYCGPYAATHPGSPYIVAWDGLWHSP